MSYVVNLLHSKKEEYQILLDLVNRQFKNGNVFRSEFEIDSAKEAKLHYESILFDIDEKLKLISK